MAYKSHNFVSGDILYATQMQDIDNQLIANTKAIADLQGNTSEEETSATSITIASVIQDGSVSTAVPTAQAVAKFVEGKGYLTSDNDTTYNLTLSEDSSKIQLISSTGNTQEVQIPTITYSNFDGTKPGLVPEVEVSALQESTMKYLRQDGTWALPAQTLLKDNFDTATINQDGLMSKDDKANLDKLVSVYESSQNDTGNTLQDGDREKLNSMQEQEPHDLGLYCIETGSYGQITDLTPVSETQIAQLLPTYSLNYDADTHSISLTSSANTENASTITLDTDNDLTQEQIITLQNLADGADLLDLIWQNASPSSSFGATTIDDDSFDLSKYDAIYVLAKLYYTSTSANCNSMSFIQTGGILFGTSATNASNVFTRRFSVSVTNGIYFQDAYNKSGQVTNNYLIPLSIYGVNLHGRGQKGDKGDAANITITRDNEANATTISALNDDGTTSSSIIYDGSTPTLNVSRNSTGEATVITVSNVDGSSSQDTIFHPTLTVTKDETTGTTTLIATDENGTTSTTIQTGSQTTLQRVTESEIEQIFATE